MTDETNPLLAAALDYAARGWRVVPLHSVDVRGCSCSSPECKSPGKHPRTPHGLTDGTTDPDQVRRWWGQWPRANVGVVTGPQSGVWMVGPDGDQGVEDLRRLCEANGPLPPTATARSGSGGRHFYFRYPADGRPIRNRKNLHGTKIDVRAHGGGPGYFVAPPSRNDKGVYEWVDDRELADAPGWLLAWAERDEVKERPVDPPTRVVGPSPVPQDRKSVHQRAALYLERCTPAVAGQRGHDALFWAARCLVWGFRLPEHEALALLGAFYNPRCQPEWGQKELLHKVREAASKPFDKEKGWLLAEADPVAACPPPSFPVQPKPAEARPWEVRPQQSARPSLGLTAAELVDKEFPPARWAVDGLLPEGLTILGGRPKQGKSWLSLLIATAVAAGHPLDGRGVPKGGRVVYLALEDTERRLKDRLLTLRQGVSWPVPERLHLVTNWPRADDGGLAHLHEFLHDHPDTVFVIVDTLAKFRTPPKGNANSYADDYQAVGGLKSLLDHHRCSGLLIHHTRKQKAEDPFDELSGTQGLSGAADGMMVLDRTRGSTEAKLFVTGRDLGDQTVGLTWAAEHCRWTLGKATAGIEADGRVNDGAKPAGMIDGCVTWLKQFLAEFAFPSNEIEAAGKAAGFSFPTVKAAKSQISRRQGGPLWARQIGGEWWNGLGSPDHWKLRVTELQGDRVSDRSAPRRDTGEGADPEDSF